MEKLKTKIIVVLGPTASGKSNLAVKLATTFNGEVISADSRQVYKGLNLGSGKITPEEMKGIRHHLLDVASPKRIFTASQFQKLGTEAIKDIIARGKLPIVCGGTGFYIQALVDSIVFPNVPPDHKLRAKLEKKTTAELCRILRKIDRRRYSEIDTHNRRRLIRAIEITRALGKVPKIKIEGGPYDPLFIGITASDSVLRRKIKARLLMRIRQGMISEVEKLHLAGVSWQKLESFGLEYREVANFLQNKNTKKEMVERLQHEIWQFSGRQMTWFKRDKRITWYTKKDWAEIKAEIKKFLKEK